MEATIFTGWIYDHMLPHAEEVKVAHPLMLRAIAAAKKKNDKIDAGCQVPQITGWARRQLQRPLTNCFGTGREHKLDLLRQLCGA